MKTRKHTLDENWAWMRERQAAPVSPAPGKPEVIEKSIETRATEPMLEKSEPMLDFQQIMASGTMYSTHTARVLVEAAMSFERAAGRLLATRLLPVQNKREVEPKMLVKTKLVRFDEVLPKSKKVLSQLGLAADDVEQSLAYFPTTRWLLRLRQSRRQQQQAHKSGIFAASLSDSGGPNSQPPPFVNSILKSCPSRVRTMRRNV